MSTALTQTQTLSRSDAESLTDRIRGAAADLAALLEQAHDGRAWVALGYSSWVEYLRSEFDLSKSRGYQPLAHARFARELEASTNVDVSSLPEGVTRQLASRSDEYATRLADAVAVAAGTTDAGVLARKVADELLRPADEPEPEPDASTLAYLEDWSEDGDLVDAVQDGLMTVAEAVKAADGRRLVHQWAQDDLQRKHRIGEGMANEALHNALQALYHLADLPTEDFKATQIDNWRLIPLACRDARVRLDEWESAAEAVLAGDDGSGVSS